MSERIASHYERMVLKPYLDYVSNRKLVQKDDHLLMAKNAAEPLYHFADLYCADKKEIKTLRLQNSEFDLIGFAVDALKHHKPARESPIAGSENIKEVTVVTSYNDIFGEYSNYEKAVIIYLRDGTERDIYEVMTNVMNMWTVKLREARIINGPYFQIERTGYVPRALAKQDTGRYTLKSAYPLITYFKNLRYNEITGTVEELDKDEPQIKALRLEYKNGNLIQSYDSNRPVEYRLVKVS